MNYTLTELDDHEQVGFICGSCGKFMELVGQVTEGDLPRCDRCGGETNGPHIVLKSRPLGPGEKCDAWEDDLELLVPQPKPDTCPM